MYSSAKVKTLEHASNIVKGIFQISTIILPNPEILCSYSMFYRPLYIMFYRLLKAESWAAAILFFLLLKPIRAYFPFAGKGSSSNTKGWELPL